jgi:hypothetical protein
MRFLLFLTFSPAAYGWTWTSYDRPEVMLQPGQCVLLESSQVCAVKAFKVVVRSKDPPADVDYDCKPGAISDNLLGWFLMKGKERISVYSADERIRCLRELDEVAD